MATRQNSYSVVDTSKATDRSHGEIVERVGGIETAIATARKLGIGHAIAHCSALLSSDENNTSVDATKDCYDLVTTDMRGRTLAF
jgi:hypothetical protein